MKFANRTLAIAVMLGFTAGASAAPMLQITFENTGASTDFVLTPLWAGLHDGSFDLFEPGAAASAGLALIAETGDASGLSAEFAGPGRVQTSGIGNPAGFGPLPVVEGGETATGSVVVMNPSAYTHFTYASMVIPSNDAFIGNDNPVAYRIFDDDGTFANPAVIEIFGADIWDAGSEVNDAMGAAFSALGGADTDEGGVVAMHPGLDNFVGTMTAAGQTIGAAPAADQLIARISFQFIPDVPEPGALALMGLGLLGLGFRRRMNATA